MDYDSAPAPKLNEKSDIEAMAPKMSMENNLGVDKEEGYSSQHCLASSVNLDLQNTSISKNNSTSFVNVNEQIIIKLPQDDEVITAQTRNKSSKEDISVNPSNDNRAKRSGAPTTDEITAAIDRLILDDLKHLTFQTDDASPKFFNTRPLDRNATTYELENFSKNKMLIFNQVDCPGEDPRDGTDKDVVALVDCFQKRAFEVVPFHDCTKTELFQHIQDAICQDMSDYGCFAIAILTHGSDYGLLKTKAGNFYESELIDVLKGSKAPSLLTKPKLLIIQACRGSGMSHAAPVGEMPMEVPFQHDSPRNKPGTYSIAEESDFLILHGTFPGMKAHRGKHYGTWFIQSLCEFINKSKPDEDISSILTHVKRDVSINHENSGFMVKDKQMPTETNTLIRTLYLNSGMKETKKRLTYSVETAPSLIPTKTSRTTETEEQSEQVEAISNEEATSTKAAELELNNNDYVVDRDFAHNSIRFWEGDVIHNVKNISDGWKFGIFRRINRWLPEKLFATDGETPKVRPWREVSWHVSNHCRAKFEYRPLSSGHLSFSPGNLIAVLQKNVKGNDWWSGRTMDGKMGIFPRSHVFLLDPKLYNCHREMCGENWKGDDPDTQQWYKEVRDLYGPKSRALVPPKSKLCPNCLNYILELGE